MKKVLIIPAVILGVVFVCVFFWWMHVAKLWTVSALRHDWDKEARKPEVLLAWSNKVSQANSVGMRVIAMQGLVNAHLVCGNTNEARKVAFELLALMPQVQGDDRRSPLGVAAQTSLFLGNLEDARKYSDELLTVAAQALPSATNDSVRAVYGRAINHANGVLGRLALREGRVEEAKKYLVASGKAPGPNWLTPDNTNMLLAKELLEKGEREPVLQYFEVCRIAWKEPLNTTEPNFKSRESKNQFTRNQNARVDQAIDALVRLVKAGKVPEFSGYYVN